MNRRSNNNAQVISSTSKSNFVMHKSRIVLAVASCALCASTATAQDAKKIPITKLGAAEARTAESVGAVTSLRVLSDGTVFLNDFPQRRMVMFDAALKQVKVIADTMGAPIPYGQRQPGLMSLPGDSTIIVDPATLALVVLNPRGEVARVMSVPRPQDINTLATSSPGTNSFDSKGRLIYRAGAGGGGGGGIGFGGGGGGRGGNQGGQGGQGGRGGQPGAGGQGGRGGAGGGFGGGEDFGGRGPGGQALDPFGGRGRGNNNAQPDSVPILRANFDTRKTDTVTFVKVPKNEFATQPTPEGGTRVITKLNPLPQADDWALLSDGTVAVVRVLDYHVDWYTVDGKHVASEKLPFDWKQLMDDDKAKLVDSLKVAADAYTKQMAAQTANGGNNAFRIAFEPVEASKLPDYYPPIRAGSTHADADGNLWILPATSSISANDMIAAATSRGGAGGRGGFGGDNGGRGGAGGAGAGGAGAAGGDRGARGARGGNAGAAGAGAAAGAPAPGAGGRGGPDVPQGPMVSLNYDVVNRKGELIERVQLPAGRTIAGFGPNGAIYLSSREGRSIFIERYKRP